MKRAFFIVLLLSIALSACSLSSRRSQADPTAPAQEATQAAGTAPAPATQEICPVENTTTTCQPAAQPVEIKGSFTFTNDIILTYYVEHAVALIDMYAFVRRDQEWEIPVASQTLGFVDMDAENMSATYTLQLPARPVGQTVDVNPDGKDETGLQVFAVAYWPNLTGGPYSEGDDPSKGWPSYLASVNTDTENKDEVTGGKLVIWAADDGQSFPSEFGADGLLFTADDPVMKVPAGYSIIDLDQKPFALTREETPELALFEPQDAAVKDYSALSYTESFDKMFETVRKEYAFNGIQGKQPDWDTLYASVSPKVADAQQKNDAAAYYRALREFTAAFKDGHVGLSGGLAGGEVQQEETAGGYGFAIRELDDGSVVVVYVTDGGPAAEAGIQVGATISEYNGTPIADALAAVVTPSTHSSDFALRYEQAQFLVRGPVGTKASFTFTNPDGQPKTVELTTIEERESLFATSLYRNYDPTALPVEYIVASSIGVGYVRINSNYDDLNLVIRLFQRALEKFKENEIPTLMIDMRANAGGANLGLAGFLHDQEITLGQLQYFSDKTGKFESDRPADKVIPNETQYRFEKMFLLVDMACASACELEAYSFSQVPGMVVVGQYPTAGVEAEVARGQFELPEGMSVQVPTGRFVLPDGSLFLEGQGVVPTEKVPVTRDTVLTDQDVVLGWALDLARK